MKKNVIIFLLLIVAILGLSGQKPLYAQEVRVNLLAGPFTVVLLNDLTFPVQTSTGETKIVNPAVTTPYFVIHNYDYPEGWHVSMECSNLTGQLHSEIINSNNLQYNKSGSDLIDPSDIIFNTDNDRITAPVTPGWVGLQPGNSVKFLSAVQGGGIGVYIYRPKSSYFRIIIPGDIPADTYTGNLTATINTGP